MPDYCSCGACQQADRAEAIARAERAEVERDLAREETRAASYEAEERGRQRDRYRAALAALAEGHHGTPLRLYGQPVSVVRFLREHRIDPAELGDNGQDGEAEEQQEG